MKMMLMANALSVALLLGCEREQNDLGVQPKETPEQVLRVQKELANVARAYGSETEPLPEERAVLRFIETLPNEDLRQRCRDDFVSLAVSSSIERLSYGRQAKVISSLLRTITALSNSMPRTDAGWQSAYGMEMKKFDWWRAQILRVGASQERIDVAENGKPLLPESERRVWRQIYYGGMEDFEAQLNDLECLFYVKKKQMTEGEWNVIKAKMETWLGRPLRSREQLKRDCKERRRVIFPDDKGRSGAFQALRKDVK